MFDNFPDNGLDKCLMWTKLVKCNSFHFTFPLSILESLRYLLEIFHFTPAVINNAVE